MSKNKGFDFTVVNTFKLWFLCLQAQNRQLRRLQNLRTHHNLCLQRYEKYTKKLNDESLNTKVSCTLAFYNLY